MGLLHFKNVETEAPAVSGSKVATHQETPSPMLTPIVGVQIPESFSSEL